MPAWLRALAGALLLTLIAFGWLSRPIPVDPQPLAGQQPDPANGERIFHAGGCASCHGDPDAEDPDPSLLPGGLELRSPLGVFRAPNISPHPDHGIGRWSALDFVNAMLRGISPGGRHYYPSFPYTSYARMSVADVLDLKAYLDTLPPVAAPSPGHSLPFLFSWRRPLGLWKRLYLDPSPVVPVAADDTRLQRGRYLVEGPGHCGECHTSRNRLGALDRSAWLAGAPSLEGEGKVPAITPGALSDWSESDLAYYLESGIDPEFDVVGGSMARVQENLARLPSEDRVAIAAYLKQAGAAR